jgi:hypothetical protein
MRFYVIAVFFAFSAMGCGSSDSKKYQFSFNGCDTGEHAFDSTEAYCAGLKSNSLNNGCAEALRKDAYERDCGQTFFPAT